MQKVKKRFVWVVVTALVICTVIAVGIYLYSSIKSDDASQPVTAVSAATAASSITESMAQQPVFNRDQYSTTDQTSIWFVVNKKIALSSEYQPADLVVPSVPLQAGKSNQEMSVRRDAAINLEAMFAAAKDAGIQLKMASGYRSYDLQSYYYNSLVKSLGAEEANKVSAKPGTSEHQTGLAVDIASQSNDVCHLETCFGAMKEGQWLANNAHLFGFIIRYPDQKTAVTGYNYEPWHVRYVGKELAEQLQKSNQTLEEFFNIL